eukprot:TRINITY_DN3224_c0_g1_i3.p1 TRINITY_DN3224_c0_g1~~TRINITY_DN3224_c0_g1_i3.p1  ORF type:complete len:118 (+),score=20.72 TRINITY_DN3224_c0_g1_i3:92-445(+)
MSHSNMAGHTGSVTSLSVHGNFLLSGGGFNRQPGGVEVLSVDSTIRLWDLRMQKEMWSIMVKPSAATHGGNAWEFERDPVLCVKLCRDGVLSGHGDGTVRVFDFSTGLCGLEASLLE